MARAEERMTSAERGIIGTMMAMMRFGIELPRMATSARASTISGNERNTSIMREREEHVHHPLQIEVHASAEVRAAHAEGRAQHRRAEAHHERGARAEDEPRE